MTMQNKRSALQPKIPSNTHKGEFGKILVVGGSQDYYGAPILTALGAEVAGADLITLYCPQEHFEAAKKYSLNFFLKGFAENILTLKDVPSILNCSISNHILAIGNGLGNNLQSKKAILEILQNINIPVILDAESLFPEILKVLKKNKRWILTPHQGEFERVFDLPFSSQNLIKVSQKYEFPILVKGPVDYIAHNGKIIENKTGCVQMRVGGTGDVLAGIVASFASQGLCHTDAVYSAVFLFGKAGEKLARQQKNFTAFELAKFFVKY